MAGEPWVERREIGPCVLYLGDALEILPTLPERSVGMVFMDPPYGHNNNNNGDLISRREVALGRGAAGDHPARPIYNDGPGANDLFRASLPLIHRLLENAGCCCCCCGGGGPDPQFARWSLWLDEVLSFVQMIIWDKGKMGLGWRYRRSYETVLVAAKSRSGKLVWLDRTRRVENIIRPGDYGIRKIIPTSRQHPTPKPVALAAHFIGLHANPGDIVLDPFMGHGSTIVAAAQLGRRAIGIEIDPDHYAIACTRIERAWAELAPDVALSGPDRAGSAP